MSDHKPIVVVDDELAIRDSLSFLLETHDFAPILYESGDAFLETDIGALNCPILMDVRMPGRNGIEVLQIALEKNPHLNIIVMSGHADIPMAVKALKLGAVDFIEKPFQASAIMGALEKAQDTPSPVPQAMPEATPNPLEKLTPREREIASYLVDGLANKAIAHELGISVRTVETHRARLMSKLDIKSLSDLVKLALSIP